MPTMTTRPSAPAPETLLLALDLGNTTWKLGARVGGPAEPPRIRAIPARDLAALRAWNGEPFPPGAAARLAREWTRLRFLRRALRTRVAERRALLRAAADAADPTPDPTLPIVRHRLAVRGIGEVSAWLYAAEFFAWRRFRNRREVGALAGRCATTRRSGAARREQGISKAGNQHARGLAIELAWNGLRYQPQRAVSQWYRRRVAAGGSRARRIGVVALARKLLIALWHYLETGRLPEGAMLKAYRRLTRLQPRSPLAGAPRSRPQRVSLRRRRIRA